MTLTLVINPGPAAFWAVLVVSVVSVAFVSFFIGRVMADRDWDRDIRKRASQQILMPWVCPGEPIVVPRVDKAATLWKPHPYREDGFEWEHRKAA